MSIFSERLKTLRLKRGLTQQEIADVLGVTRVAYSNWENGKREPKIDMTISLSKILNTSLDYLIGEVNFDMFNISKDTFGDMTDEDYNNFFRRVWQLQAFQIFSGSSTRDEVEQYWKRFASMRQHITSEEIMELIDKIVEDFHSENPSFEIGVLKDSALNKGEDKENEGQN